MLCGFDNKNSKELHARMKILFGTTIALFRWRNSEGRYAYVFTIHTDANHSSSSGRLYERWPGSIPRDRTDYARAMRESWKEQMLLNIVMLRYLDPPMFLDVSSVISSYQLESQVSFSSEIFPRSPFDTNYRPGLSGTYTDRPTISYTPLTVTDS